MSYDMELRADTLYHRARCDVCGKTAENVIENTCLFPDADEADETATSNGWQVWLNESTGIIRHRCDDHWIADCAKCGKHEEGAVTLFNEWLLDDTPEGLCPQYAHDDECTAVGKDGGR